jgi:anti-sigma factor RsiW
MAITIDTWNRMSFLPFSDTAWTSLTNPPTLQSAFMKALLAGATVQGYVVQDGDPFILSIEGAIAEFPAATVDTESTVSGSVTITDSVGNVSSQCRSASGSLLYWYTPANQTVVSYGSADIVDLHTVTT